MQHRETSWRQLKSQRIISVSSMQIRAETSIWVCFWVWEPPQRWPAWGSSCKRRLKKLKAITVLDPLLGPGLKQFVYVCVFTTCAISIFSEPPLYHTSRPRGTQKVRFLNTLGTKSNKFSVNQKKSKLHYRLREDTQIKLYRVCVSICFVICWWISSTPAIFTFHLMHNPHYAQFMDPFGVHFGPKLPIIFLLNFKA
jgi:hypothetical protein